MHLSGETGTVIVQWFAQEQKFIQLLISKEDVGIFMPNLCDSRKRSILAKSQY